MENQTTEVAVAGGGMVGGALALGLAQQGFRVAVIEHSIPEMFDASRPPDVRISAISQGSVRLLEQLKVWQQVMAMRCHAYRRLETREWDNARVVFDAAQLNLPQLGYMVENQILQRALWDSLEAHPLITLYAPAQLAALEKCADQHQLRLQDGRILRADLIVGADGASSQIRQQAGMGIYGWQYNQSCLLITVRCTEPPGDCSWQRFTPDGPQALLPLFDHWATLVWYHNPARIRQLQAMTAEQLQQQIVRNFPPQSGEITPLHWGAFPLIRRHACNYVKPGFALAGDAAHTIHPLAGQGVNLGYRDVRALLEVLTEAKRAGEAWAEYPVLRRYQRRRIADNHLMQGSMDLFYFAFCNQHQPLKILRNLGLMAAQRTTVLKRQVLKYALGI